MPLMPPHWLPRSCAALVDAAKAFWRDDGPQWAASIAYYSLLSLFPLLLALGSVAAHFIDPHWLVGKATGWLGNYLPHGEAEVEQTVTRALALGRSRGWLIIVPLLWTGSLVFGALARALNVALDIEERSSLLRRLGVRLAMLLGLGGLFVVALAAPMLLRFVGSGLLDTGSGGHWLIGGLLRLLPAAMLLLALLLAYRFVPRIRPLWRAAVAGAVAATALFHLARPIFLGYVEGVSSYGLVYGSLAGLIAAVLWSWIFWMIVLFGGQIACGHARRRMRPEPVP